MSESSQHELEQFFQIMTDIHDDDKTDALRALRLTTRDPQVWLRIDTELARRTGMLENAGCKAEVIQLRY